MSDDEPRQWVPHWQGSRCDECQGRGVRVVTWWEAFVSGLASLLGHYDDGNRDCEACGGTGRSV